MNETNEPANGHQTSVHTLSSALRAPPVPVAPLPKKPVPRSHSPRLARSAINLFDLTKAIHASLGWHRHPRNGKVARLPEPARNLINVMLEDGVPYRAILDKLQRTGCLPYPLSEVNLSNWFHGGYRDWLHNKSNIAAGLPPQFDVATPFSTQIDALRVAAARRFAPVAQAHTAAGRLAGTEQQPRLTAPNCG